MKLNPLLVLPALCVIAVALGVSGGVNSTRAAEGPTLLRLNFCMNCVHDGECSELVVQHRVPPIAEPGEGQYPIPATSSTHGCIDGFCYPHHESCGGDSDAAFEESVATALRSGDVDRLRQVLVASGRTVIVDHRRGTLSLLACNGKDVLVTRRATERLLRELAGSPSVTAVAMKRGG